MQRELEPLPSTTRAQASEIQRAAEIGGVITDYVNKGEVLTIWAREDDGSIGMQRIERFAGAPPTLVQYASIHFDGSGNINKYTGSCLSSERRFIRFLPRWRPKAEVQKQAQATVTSLVEFVFRNLD